MAVKPWSGGEIRDEDVTCNGGYNQATIGLPLLRLVQILSMLLSSMGLFLEFVFSRIDLAVILRFCIVAFFLHYVMLRSLIIRLKEPAVTEVGLGFPLKSHWYDPVTYRKKGI